MQIISTTAHTGTVGYLAALGFAERRALHSYFDQHIVEDADGCYVAIDEGDYDALPMTLSDRVVHTVPGCMADEF